MKLSQNQKNFIIAASIAAGGYLLYSYFTRKKGSKLVTNSDGTVTPPDIDNFPVSIGDKGEKVKELQTALNKIDPTGYPTTEIDGIFGERTQAALMKALGKTAIQSQEDINAILEKVSSTATKSARVSLAKDFISKLNANKNVGIMTVHEVEYTKNNKKVVVGANTILFDNWQTLGKNAYYNDNGLLVLMGMNRIDYTSVSVIISPWAVGLIPSK